MKTIVNKLSGLERTIQIDMLKYLAGKSVFCPSCNVIADYRTIIEISIFCTGKNDSEKTQKYFYACKECWATKRKAVQLTDKKLKAAQNVFSHKIVLLTWKESNLK